MRVKEAGPAEKGRLSRRDRGVLENLALGKAVSVRVPENLPVHVDLHDLGHPGILGLFDAAPKKKPGQKKGFSSYAQNP